MMINGTQICSRCEKDAAAEITVSCDVCRVYGICLDCAAIHNDTCLKRIREGEPARPRAVSVPTPPRESLIDSPALWVVLMAGTFAALLARIVL